jgi:hypothetical protein
MKIVRRPIALSHSERGITIFHPPTGVYQGDASSKLQVFSVDGKLRGKVPDVLNFADSRRTIAWRSQQLVAAALEMRIASIFGGGTVTPDATPKLTVNSSS